MTETNVQPIPSNSQHHDTPNNKTHIIKFRVTETEKMELQCKTECCPVLPGGRTDATSREIRSCAYDQSENRPGVPESDPAADGR